MAYARFPFVLSLCRWLVTGALLAAGLQALLLVIAAFSVSKQPQVQLALDSTRPPLFGFWHGMQQGFEEGKASTPAAQRGLPRPQLAAGPAFELVANNNVPLLRYREPSAPRRVVLLALGAWSGGGPSVVGVLLLGLGGWLLLRLLLDVTPEQPFTPANARRLFQLALLILGLNLWNYVARVLVLALVPPFEVAELLVPLNHYVYLSADEVVPGFLMGAILFVIAAVYQRGVALSQEAELVI